MKPGCFSLIIVWMFIARAASIAERLPAQNPPYPPYPLPSGASLAVEESIETDGIKYRLLYTQPGGATNVVWNLTLNQDLLSFSTIASAYEGGGMVTALVPLGRDTVFFRIPTSPVLGKPRIAILEDIDSNSGDIARKTFRLIDHNRFEATDSEGKINSIFVNTKDYTATMDGKPLQTWLFKDGRFRLPASAKFSADDVFDEKVKLEPLPLQAVPETPLLEVTDRDAHAHASPPPTSPTKQATSPTAATPVKTEPVSPVQVQTTPGQKPIWLWVTGLGILVVIIGALWKRHP